MATIFIIGGGELQLGETRAIDEAVVALCPAREPLLLFLPTASGDSPGYIATVEAAFGAGLGCRVEAGRLLGGPAEVARTKALLREADIVYVGGGDTAKLLAAWRDAGLVPELRAALERGAILGGLSAGSICWFESGVSDYRSFSAEGRDEWAYESIAGLGFLPGCHSPHHDERLADVRYRDYLGRASGEVLCLDNGAGLIIESGAYRLVRSLPGAEARMLTCGGGSWTERILPERGSLRD